MVMQVTADQSYEDQVASLLGWWRAAGVDVAIDEQPRNWLANTSLPGLPASASATASKATVSAVRPPAAVTQLPDTLDIFRSWLAKDQGVLAAYPPHCRVMPTGESASGVMLVSDVPERGDAEAGALMSGDVGRLLDRMLAAVGRDRASAYLATVAPARPPGGRLTDDATDALAQFVRHHIRLVRPARLWLLGRAASRAVLGVDDMAAAGRIHDVNLDGVTMVAIATLHPGVLLANPKFKARVWADMQRLFEDRT